MSLGSPSRYRSRLSTLTSAMKRPCRSVVSMTYRVTATSRNTLTSAIERSCRDCLASMIYRIIATGSCTLNICDRASVPEPFASMTYRAILGRCNTLTSAIERSCCCERQSRSGFAGTQRFSLLHFRRFSTVFHSPHAAGSGHRERTPDAAVKSLAYACRKK